MVLTLLTMIFGVLMSLSWFAQAWHLYKHKSSKEVSPIFLFTFLIGIFVWLLYGIVSQDAVVIASFGVGAVGICLLTMLYFKYR